MKSKIGLDLPTRRQPGRAARPTKLVFDDSSSSEPKPSPGGIRKRTARASDELPEPKRVKAKNRGPTQLLIERLEARVSKMDNEVALAEQNELLNAGPVKLPTATPEPGTPGSAKSKRGRPRKKRGKEELYMDDFLASDAEEVEKTRAQPGQGERIQLRRGERWIPEMEHRRRVAKRPQNVPSQVWISYCLLDDYIYRHSLTDEEVLKLPLLDDVLDFQMGRGQPVTLEGYHWNSKKHLVPIPEPARGTETEVPTLPSIFDR